MRVLLATSVLASILISSSITAEAGPLETAPPPAAAAPIVHVQPRVEDLMRQCGINRRPTASHQTRSLQTGERT
jgi:hypothetical protein